MFPVQDKINKEQFDSEEKRIFLTLLKIQKSKKKSNRTWGCLVM